MLMEHTDLEKSGYVKSRECVSIERTFLLIHLNRKYIYILFYKKYKKNPNGRYEKIFTWIKSVNASK